MKTNKLDGAAYIIAIVLALMFLVQSWGAKIEALPSECPVNWRDMSTKRMDDSAKAYVSLVQGESTFAEALNITANNEMRAATFSHCGQAAESDLVMSNLDNVKDAVIAYHNYGFNGITNSHLDRAFNARNELLTQFNWTQ